MMYEKFLGNNTKMIEHTISEGEEEIYFVSKKTYLSINSN